jgi:SurA-like protein
MRRSRLAVVLTLAVAAPAPAAAAQLPPDVVAQTGSQTVTLSDYEHWLAVALKAAPVPVDPPRFERCVAAERRADRSGPRKRCERRHRAGHRDTMSFLVQAAWIRQEAADMGIAVSGERLRRELERQKDVSFPNERAYRRFLRTSGMTETDILVRVELDALQTRLTMAATARARPVTKADARRWVARHPRLYRGKPRRTALSLARARITSRRQQHVLAVYIEEFRERNRARTACAPGYRVAECG